VLEIGPGTGILTEQLLHLQNIDLSVIEIDKESIQFLHNKFLNNTLEIIEADFLQFNFIDHFKHPTAVIGNFPYNISSQILFSVLKSRQLIPELVGMFQKEVAERVYAPPGTKTYGILSVLVKAFYDVEYLFPVSEKVFIPPPKVKSAVIRLKRNNTSQLSCDEELFFDVVKTAFNQRRKTLRNALKKFGQDIPCDPGLLSLRAEQLDVNKFIDLTQAIKKRRNL
jgi:16S rRNA (adenine1518-N6/adenine1519-N6)-dimethyltransferase